jgi:aspartate aminotransferase
MSSNDLEPHILNANILRLKESATLAINQEVKRQRAEGRAVVHFGFGQSPFEVHPKIQQALIDHAGEKEYLPTLGLPELREAIARFYFERYGYQFSPQEILIGPGSKELIFQVLFLLDGPLLIPAPSWVSYGPQAQIRGKHVHTIQTSRENRYKVTAEELEQACEGLIVNRQKILILNNPNNPTGAVYHDDELKAIAEVAKEHGVIVISDEIYALNDFSGRPFKGFSQYYPEGTIVTGGLSKGFSAGGYRLGFLAAPENMSRIMKALSAMVSETFSSVSAPIQYAAIAAFSNDDEVMKYTEQCTQIHRAAGAYLAGGFRKLGLNCPDPEGAFYVFPDFVPFAKQLKKAGLQSSIKLCHALLDQYGVAMLPGSDFYCPEDYPSARVATVDYDGAKVYEASTKAQALDDKFVEAHCPNLKLGLERVGEFIDALKGS